MSSRNQSSGIIPKRFETIVFVFFMTFLMGMTLSAVFELTAPSGEGAFVARWLSSFASTYIIVVPVVIVVSPIATWISSKLVKQTDPEI